MSKFLFSFAVIATGLASGFLFNRLLAGPLAFFRKRAETLRVRLQWLALLVINPIAFVGAVWALDLSDASLLALPVVGLSTLMFGALLGLAGSRLLGLPPERAGVYIPSSSFTNIGSIGGLIIFVLAGEAGFALVPFYKLFEETWYYSVLFPTAKRYGEIVRAAETGRAVPGGASAPAPRRDSRWEILRRVATDPFILISLGSVSAGLILNLAGARRPSFYPELNSVLIPLASWIVLFTIGMRMKIGNLFEDPRTVTLLISTRQVLLPAFALCLGTLLGLGRTEGAIGLKTVLVLSSMPIGFLGVVPPALYGLDVEFANRLWLVSNSMLVVTVPVLSALLHLF